jgi:hypothetical protein
MFSLALYLQRFSLFFIIRRTLKLQQLFLFSIEKIIMVGPYQLSRENIGHRCVDQHCKKTPHLDLRQQWKDFSMDIQTLLEVNIPIKALFEL